LALTALLVTAGMSKTKQMKLKHALLLLLFVSWGCSTNMSRHVMARVSPEPSNEVWYFRTEFIPVHKTIRGVPVEQIDSSWRLASELVGEALPYEGFSAMQELNLSFSRSGDFNHDGVEDLAVVGVYETQSLDRGSFILVFSKNTDGTWRKVFVQRLVPPFFLALTNENESIELLFCMNCESDAVLIWDKEENQYQLRWFEDEEH
jgi:hypothetical protein